MAISLYTLSKGLLIGEEFDLESFLGGGIRPKIPDFLNSFFLDNIFMAYGQWRHS